MNPTPDSANAERDDDQQQFQDLALVFSHTTAVKELAVRLHREPTSPSASADLRMLLGVPADLTRSALERLQETNRRHRLRLIEGGADEGGADEGKVAN